MAGLDAMVSAAVAFVVTALSGIFLIPYLKRLRFGQSIRDVGPVWHKNKQGTPTMGGMAFIFGIMLAFVITMAFFLRMYTRSESARLVIAVLMAVMYGFIGFMDDYIKVVKKRNLGLTVRQKLFLQTLAGIVFLIVIYICGMRSTKMTVPFFGNVVDFGIFYWPVALFIIIGTVNSVNLTDGIDGLASSVTFVASIAFMLCACVLGFAGFASLSAALAGGCVGFLIWNFHPAKVFMGDTGSLFLGGLVCAIAFGIGQPLLLVPVGIIYFIEALSDIIQVISFKSTGKRVFKMAPIHHHFELSGWSEVKIVGVFSAVTAVCSAAAVFWVYLMFAK